MSTDSDRTEPRDVPSPPSRRRSSFAELFASRPPVDSSATSRSQGSSSMATAISQQAQRQSQTRRLSITTLGLSGGPAAQQTSPFGTLKRGQSTNDAPRRSSVIEGDSAVDDEDAVPPMSPGFGKGDAPARPPPGGGASPLGRRLSLGARAYSEAFAGSPSAGGAEPGSSGVPTSPGPLSASGKGSSPPSMKGKDGGFSWSETMRSRAERTSLSAAVPTSMAPLTGGHNRSKSGAPPEPPAPLPVPKPAPKAPDHFQERILKGDFYMD